MSDIINKTENADKEQNAEMKIDESSSKAEQSTDKSDSESKSSASEVQNDGVKILEEVFGKASVGDKEEEKGYKNDNSSFGPVPPTEAEYDPEEIAKAEEFKNQGNKYFAGKFSSNFLILNRK